MPTLERATDRGARTVRATINYTRRAGDPLRTYYLTDPPPGEPESNKEDEPHDLLIASAREIPGGPKLEVEGFQLVDFTTGVEDIYDAEQRERVYVPEVAAMIKDLTGASKVHISDHFLRGPEAQRRAPASIWFTADFAHADYTPTSAAMWLGTFFPEHAHELAQRRTAIINIWRPIVGPLQDRPLAVCDATSLRAGDLLPWLTVSVIGDGGLRTSAGKLSESESAVLAWNEDHRWYYVPDMMPDEALLISSHDSRRPGAHHVPHTAFNDPTTPTDARPRASIDVRAFLLW